tara:strand:- start:18 stop:296 length:279 start_codon:yes stop_codon:yes gene_type:complete
MRDLSKPLAPTFGAPKRRVVTKGKNSKSVVVTRKDGSIKKVKYTDKTAKGKKSVMADKYRQIDGKTVKVRSKYRVDGKQALDKSARRPNKKK